MSFCLPSSHLDKVFGWEREMHSSKMCLLHLTQPFCIREVRGPALIDVHVIDAQGANFLHLAGSGFELRSTDCHLNAR